jgi:DNA-binding XRE family transcriptional regulator
MTTPRGYTSGSGSSYYYEAPKIIVLLTDHSLVGTGGNLNNCTVGKYPAQDSTAPDARITQQATPKAAPVAQSLADRISEIKAAFGLTVSQLAQVIQVQRQTIYDWMDEDHPPQVQGHKRERLAAIQRWAIQWNALCPWPAGKGVASYAVEGNTLLDLLAADVLDEARLATVLRGLSEQVKAEWRRKEERSLANRLRARGFQPAAEPSLRSVLAGMGGTVSLNDDDS